MERTHEIGVIGKEAFSTKDEYDINREPDKGVFDEYIDGEEELSKNNGVFSQLRESTRLSWIDFMLSHKQFKRVSKYLLKVDNCNEEASKVLYELSRLTNWPLHQAAILLSKGANPNYQPRGSPRSIMHLLASNSMHNAVWYIGKSGGNCDALEADTMRTPLQVACSQDFTSPSFRYDAQLKTITVLLSAKHSTIDNQDIGNCTALDYAMAASSVWAVKALVSAGASVSQSKIYTKILSDRREKTLLSQFLVDFNASRAWIQILVLRHGASNVCRGLAHFKLRLELRTSVNTRAVQVEREDRIDINLRDPMLSCVSPASSRHIQQQQSDAEVAVLVEKRHERRQKSKAAKLMIRTAKEKSTVEKLREEKRSEYLKRIEDEYKVSFRGLFPK